MFAKICKIALVASALVAGVIAKPAKLVKPKSSASGTNRIISYGGNDISFNKWGGLSSMAGFDDFYGRDNFVGYCSNYGFVKQDKEVVCHSEAVKIVQQRLLVIQELAKRVITEQLCDVETQTIAFEQFRASTGLFSDDIRRLSGRPMGYDANILGHFKDIVGQDGSLSTHDFGFSGRDLGKHTVVVRGANWNDMTSPATVGFAYFAAQNAIFDDDSFSVFE